MRATAEVDKVVSHIMDDRNADVFKDETGESFITIFENGASITASLESKRWTSLLLTLVRRKSLRASSHKLDEITSELRGIAEDRGIVRRTFVRVGRDKDDIIIDLNNLSRQVVRISKQGVQIEVGTLVPFLRQPKQLALPTPVAQADLKVFHKKFRRWFLGDTDTYLLILAFMLKALHRDHGAYAILVVEGPQGSGKSSLCGRIKALIDPADPAFYSAPKDNDDVIVASKNSHLLVFDNISQLRWQMSDMFCRLSTGGGISKRKLYENHEEATYSLHRPCIINGISEPTTRADFLDRSISIRMEELSAGQRQPESQMTAEFDLDVPILLGGLYGLLSKCLVELETLQISDLPRLGDYFRMGLALETVLKLRPGSFRSAFESNRAEQEREAFWSDTLCVSIYELLQKNMNNGTSEIHGTASDILKSIQGRSKNRELTLNSFTAGLKRVQPLLRNQGIVVDRTRTAERRDITIRWLNPPSQAPKDGDECFDL